MDLKQYLDENTINKAAFAKKIGISRQTLHSILKGGGVDANTCLKIIRGTKNAVTLEDLVSNANEKKKREKPKPKTKNEKNITKNDPKTNSLKRRGG